MAAKTFKTTADLERLLSVREIAELENVSTKTIRRLIAARELLALKDGRSLRVRPQDLSAYRLRRLLSE